MSNRDFETGERMKDETQPHDLQQASPLYVASLARGMVLLESFRDGAPLLGITDLVRITGFEKNLVQRLTNTLYQMGYLGKDQARRKYYLTPRILTHSFNYLRSRKLFALAMPALIDLREDLHRPAVAEILPRGLAVRGKPARLQLRRGPDAAFVLFR